MELISFLEDQVRLCLTPTISLQSSPSVNSTKSKSGLESKLWGASVLAGDLLRSMSGNWSKLNTSVYPVVLEIGCGHSALPSLALGSALKMENTRYIISDYDEAALIYAKKNAGKCGETKLIFKLID